jgi:hypothetical protein
MLSWLKNEIKNMFYVLCHMITGKQPYQVDQFFKARAKYSADDIYDSIIANLEALGRKEPCTVITSFENISVLSSAGLIVNDEHTTRQWLKIIDKSKPITTSIQIASSPYHGNNYANVVFSEVSSGLEKS